MFDFSIMCIEHIIICVWSDYEWCYKEDLEEVLSFKSDDYKECKYYFLGLDPTYEDLVNLYEFGD